MSSILILALTLFSWSSHAIAKTQSAPKSDALKPEVTFLNLKLKKEINDKKLTAQKKYVLAILAARELKQLNLQDKSVEYYKIANEIKVDENKNEINLSLAKKPHEESSLFFFEVNLKQLLRNKSYDKALLSLNPEKLKEQENKQYRIIYDMLNVKARKSSVKKLYCLDDYQKNPEDYQFFNLACEMLSEYLRDGKIGNDHIKLMEEYFFKHDLKDRYLLQVAKDLKASL